MNITPKPCVHVTSLSLEVETTKNVSGFIYKSSSTEVSFSKVSRIINETSRNVSISHQGNIFKKIFRRIITYVERDFDMQVMTFKKSSVIRNRR
jgi:hypothetical protein